MFTQQQRCRDENPVKRNAADKIATVASYETMQLYCYRTKLRIILRDLRTILRDISIFSKYNCNGLNFLLEHSKKDTIKLSSDAKDSCLRTEFKLNIDFVIKIANNIAGTRCV